MQVDVQGIPLHVVEHGAGVPVLLIHGWSADHRYLAADVEPVFAQRPGFRRLYVDLPGHGATPAPAWLGSQEQMLGILRELVDRLVGEQPLAVVGSSYGGYLALGLVRTLSERLLGACLIVPDLPDRDGARILPAPTVIREDRAALGELADDEAWIRGALVVHERWMLDELRAHDVPAYRSCDRAFLARLEADYLHVGPAAEPGAPFGGPSLVATGRQDATVGFRAAADLLDELPRATYAVIDLAGHHLGRIERPQLFRALVDDWLERVAAEAGS